MYTSRNFKTKKLFKEHVLAYLDHKKNCACGDITAAPEPVTLYAPGLGSPKDNGIEFVEGPHYPAPHTWYAQVTVENGIVVKVK